MEIMAEIPDKDTFSTLQKLFKKHTFEEEVIFVSFYLMFFFLCLLHICVFYLKVAKIVLYTQVMCQ